MNKTIRYALEAWGITDFDNRASYVPWTNRPERVVMGFEVTHIDRPTERIYIMPILDEGIAAIGVFRGRGDPDHDQRVYVIRGQR